MSSFVRFEGVKKVYRMGEVEIEALRSATFAVEKGELCVIVGPSGAGKTTLLNILGGMDTLTEGRVFLGMEEISAYNAKRLTAYRRHDIGFVFQFYNLVPNLTALENVELDYHTGKSILKLLQLMSRKNGMTVVIITHNSALTAMADRVIQVKNGTVTSVEYNDRPIPVEEIEW